MLPLALYRPHGHSGERDPDSLRHDAVAYRVGDGRVADDIEPLGDRDLRRDYGGVVAEPVFDDLEKRQPILGVEGNQPEIIEDEQRRPGDAADESLVSSRRPLLLEGLEELRAVEVGGTVPEAAGLGAEGL